ncbi:MAG: hypothetical protein Q9219_002311 [cf. Caloplaca sp. 3 TL-2023]
MASTADSLTPASIVFPTLALIAVLFDIPPLVWHTKNRNVAACNLISWAIFTNLCNFVNAMIWPTDDIPSWFHGYVLCDIEAKLLLAATIGISGSLACIMRALAKVLDTENTIIVPTQKQRYTENIITALLCFGGPIYFILIHYVVQPSRYYILAISGCTTSVDNSWPSVVLVIMWPVLLCLAATYYGLVVLFRIRKYRRDFSSVLTASSSQLTASRFLRLFLLSFLLVLIFLPFQLYQLYLNVSSPLLPYDWNAIHGPGWMNIIMIPQHGSVPLDRWITVTLGILLFLFFGLGGDATRMYRKWYLKLRLSSKGSEQSSSFTHAQSSSISHDNGSLTSLLFDFCRKRLSWRRSFISTMEKHDTTTMTTLASPVDAEKMSDGHDWAYPSGQTNASSSVITSSEGGPSSTASTHSIVASISTYLLHGRRHASPPDDIELALQRHESHRPNRFIAGLWHVNNAATAGRVPAAQGLGMGLCNGLRL